MVEHAEVGSKERHEEKADMDSWSSVFVASLVKTPEELVWRNGHRWPREGMRRIQEAGVELGNKTKNVHTTAY